MKMPQQSELIKFYGNPSNKQNPTLASTVWEKTYLVTIKPPFKMTYASQPMKHGIVVHSRCAVSLQAVLNKIWLASGQSQAVIDDWGVSVYGGCYNYRLKRSGDTLSVHAFGAAIDLDPTRNAYKSQKPNFALHPEVIAAFESEGWVWGGRWKGKSCDGMHFQAAIV